MTDFCPNSFFNAFVDMRDVEECDRACAMGDGKRFYLFKHKRTGVVFFVKEQPALMWESRRFTLFLREVETQLLLAQQAFSLFRGFCIQDSPKAPSSLPGMQSGYLFFKHIKRGSLRHVISRNSSNPLTVTEAACVIVGLPFLIEHMHRHNIAHRDIKPENIVVDDDGRPWLIDFELARGWDMPKRQFSMLVGTESYRAPEIPNTIRPDESWTGEQALMADIFALGITLVEAATGKYPFEVSDGFEIISEKQKLYDDNHKSERCRKIRERFFHGDDDISRARAVWEVLVAMEMADFEANGKVIEPALREILRGCLKPLAEDRPPARGLREQIENVDPSDLIRWNGESPDGARVEEYRRYLIRNLVSSG